MNPFRKAYGALVVIAVALTPVLAHARTFKELVNGSIVPFGEVIVRLIYALAFIVFLAGMVNFFFSQNEESRQKGKQFAIWGIIGLAVMFATWGILHTLLTILMDIGA